MLCIVILVLKHYRISKLCRVSVTLGKGQVTLGKVFAECNTRQTTLGKESHGNEDFAECRITGTRQRICRVPWHSVNKPRGATPGPALCRVSNGRHSAKSPRRGPRHVAALPSAGLWHSVKCPRQGAATWLFYRVLALGKKHSAKRVSVYLISMKLVNFRSMYAVHQFKEK